MARAGYVQGVKSRGKYFFYVRRSYRNKEGKPVNESIIALGQKEKALKLLQSWIDDPETKPEAMQKYKEESFKKWMDYILEK